MLDKAIRLYGEDIVIDAVCGAIILTASVFNVGRNMTDDQAMMLASDLVAKYRFENIEDILLMLKGLRTSGTTMYGKFDAETIFSEMDKYMDVKIDEMEHRYTEVKREFQIDAARDSSQGVTLKEKIRASIVKNLTNGSADKQ